MNASDSIDLITRVCNAAKHDVAPKEAANYRDNRHNQYVNAVARGLHEQKVSFEKAPNIEHNGRACQPDILMKDAVLEVKAKYSGFNTRDGNKQIPGYKEAANLPAYGVNFGRKGDPHVREF